MRYGLLILMAHIFMFIVLLDRIKTDLHRFKPNSCTILNNEQLYPWKKLHIRAMVSRHRGDKRRHRYDRSVDIILLTL